VHSGTAFARVALYTGTMQSELTKTAIACAWIVGLGAAALILAPESASSWTMLVAVGVLPPVVMLRLWNAPAQTMSESIREALRK
jgi:hypothetical protein